MGKIKKIIDETMTHLLCSVVVLLSITIGMINAFDNGRWVIGGIALAIWIVIYIIEIDMLID